MIFRAGSSMLFIGAVVSMAAAGAPALAANGSVKNLAMEHVPNELLVKFDGGKIGTAAQVKLLKAVGAKSPDAILDRLVHNAYRFELDGHSMRRSTDPTEKVDEGCPA